MKKKILNLLMIVSLIIMICSAGYLIKYYFESQKSEDSIDSLRTMIVDAEEKSDNKKENHIKNLKVNVDGVSIQKKFSNLYRENHDFVGWITIPDTNIDYPVMYTPNDSEKGEYYIHRNFQKEYSASGLPFIDRNCNIENPTDNIIIYGHNMKSGKMFHDIIKYENQDFYNSHKTISFDTIYGDGEYEVFAAFYGKILENDSKDFKYYEFVNAGTKEEFDHYVKEIKKMSIIDTNVDVEYGDELITLSTCAYHTNNGRFAILAKKKIK